MTTTRHGCALVLLPLVAASAFLLALPSSAAQPVHGDAQAAVSSQSPTEQAVHYIVFQKQPDATVKPVFYQRVQLDAALESLSAAQAHSLLAQADRQSDLVQVVLQAPGQGVVFRTIVDVPRWLRGEFEGDKPGASIDGHIFPAEDAVFVVRVPAIAGATLVVENSAATELGRFDLADLVAATPQLNLDALNAQVIDLRVTGSSANRVDMLIVGDGYTAAQQPKFISDVQDMVDSFFYISPYAEYANFVNVRALFVASAQAGADHPPYVAGCSTMDAGRTCCGDSQMQWDPLRGMMVDTAFGATYCIQNLHRLMGINYAAVAAAAAAAPEYDKIMVLVNDTTYGGAGGSFTVVSMSPDSVGVARHEYGHSFARLADEYESPYPGYPPCSDRGSGYSCEDNVTDVTARDQIKWRFWFSPTTPIPTVPQWDPAYANVVGLFEGARYLSTGIYRSGQNCIMRYHYAPFCQVPSQIYVLRFYRGGWGSPWSGIRLIEPDSVQPRARVIVLRHPATQVLSASILQPVGSPPVRVSWLVNDAVAPGATGSVFTYTTSAGVGLARVTMRAEDTTPLVHLAMAGSALISEHTWLIVGRQIFLPLILNVRGAW